MSKMTPSQLNNVINLANPAQAEQDNWERLNAFWNQMLGTGNLFTTLARQTHNNPTVGVEVSLVSASLAGDQDVPADSLVAGTLIRVRGYGQITDTDGTSTTAQLRIYLDSTEILGTNLASAQDLFGNFFNFEAIMAVRSIGATGKIIGFMNIFKDSGLNWVQYSGSEKTIDTTQDLTLDVRANFSATNGTNWSIYTDMVTAELMKP